MLFLHGIDVRTTAPGIRCSDSHHRDHVIYRFSIIRKFLFVDFQKILFVDGLYCRYHVMFIKSAHVPATGKILLQILYGMKEYLLHIKNCIIVAITA